MFHRVKSESEKVMQNQADVNERQQDIETSIEEADQEVQAPMQPVTEEIENKEIPMNDTPETPAEEQKPAAKAVDIPYSAPTAPRPAYSNTSSYGYGQATTTTEHNTEERRLVIGQGITMSGEIEHCDTLLVEGTIEAALKGAKSLEISETGTFYGTVEIDEAHISGRFEGDLTVNGRLVVASGGTITGSISYKELQIEAGAVIDGKLTPLKENAGGMAKKPAAPVKKDKSAKEAAALAKARELKGQNNPANEEGELFSATAAE
ncbi:MAG: polymer-forming cytoskeletal protein [Alphaproteobacteria bacterium]